MYVIFLDTGIVAEAEFTIPLSMRIFVVCVSNANQVIASGDTGSKKRGNESHPIGTRRYDNGAHRSRGYSFVVQSSSLLYGRSWA